MKKRSLLVIICLMFVTFLVSCDALSNRTPKVELEVQFNDLSVMYDGNEHQIELEGELPEGYRVEYTNNSATGIGVYEAEAKVYDESTDKVVEKYEATLIIDTVYENVDYIVDGNTFEHKLDVEVGEGFKLVYTNNKGFEQGIYYCTAELVNNKSNEVVNSYYSIMTIDNPKNEEFELLMDEVLILLFQGDQFSINFFFNDYESYGIEHQEALINQYVRSENWEAEQAELQTIIDEVAKFENEVLSFEQEDTMNIVLNTFEYMYNITENMNYMGNSYIGSYLGKQSNLPLELAEYKFREEQDILDFLSYLDSSLEAFESYYQYTVDQVEFGTATPNYVIDNVIAQCNEFVEMGEENFLIGIFNEKIDNISFETKVHTVEEYKALAKEGITGPLTAAYKYLADNLPALKDKATVDGGLAQYGEEGVEYYILQMKDILGLKEFNGDEAIRFLENKMNSVYNEIMKVINNAQRLPANDYNKFVSAATGGGPKYSDYSFDEVITYFQEASKKLVPELDVVPEISIKEVPEALQESYSPAAYYVSPLDETKYESIYLNPKYTNDYNYIFTTLAHEGYPGHLYQNVYSKNLDINDVRKVIRCQGYMEGWATYVEIQAYKFATNYKSSALIYALEYTQLNDQYSSIVNALADLVIHYKGYTLEEFAAYLTKILGYEYSVEDAEPFYRQIAEIPTNMSMYIISYNILDELHDCAQEKLGKAFNIIEFNTVILDSGAAPLYMVIENVYEYINEVSFLTTGEIIY